MREIKYRAKVNEKGLDKFWEYGGIIHITERYKDEEDFEECDIWQLINTDGVSFNVDETTIGEYTGLKDKNEKEIYEGDIVKINAHSYDFGFEKDRIGEIRFIEGCFGFYKQLSEKKYLFNELSTESGYGELEYYEVIGNIYDNPELLEEG